MSKKRITKTYYNIAVCGASKIADLKKAIKEKAIEIGKEIAKRNCVLLTGATTGISTLAAKGAKEAGGITIGLSPAVNLKDHLKRYRLPVDNLDVILYTEIGYAGRNFLLTKFADGVVIISGGFGTLNEFTCAFEEGEYIGVLEGTSGIADIIKDLIKKLNKNLGHQDLSKVVFDKNPKRLIKKLLNLIEKKNK